MRWYPFTAATIARPIPVLPLVGSTIVAPGRSRPSRSAASIIASAMRSFTLPAGLSDSNLPKTCAPPGGTTRCSRTSGVLPISSSTLSATNGRTPTGCSRGADVLTMARSLSLLLDVIHDPPLGRLLPVQQLLQRHAVEDRVGGLLQLAPHLGQHAVGDHPAALLVATRQSGR